VTFPIHLGIAPEHSSAVPKQADAVVIGGGIIGVMTAWELAKSGLKTVLLEKGRIAGEQSSRNWGWIRAQGRDIAELPIALEAQTLWPELDKRTGGLGLQQTGTLYLAKTDADMQGYQDWLDRAAPAPLPIISRRPKPAGPVPSTRQPICAPNLGSPCPNSPAPLPLAACRS
jgi:glycine/D-amino acid oxidase-like deaminating enzyme